MYVAINAMHDCSLVYDRLVIHDLTFFICDYEELIGCIVTRPWIRRLMDLTLLVNVKHLGASLSC